MLIGNNLTKKKLQDYVRKVAGNLFYEPYKKGEFCLRNPVKTYPWMDSEPIIDVKDKYITYPKEIEFDGKTWNNDWSQEYHLNYHIIPEKMVYEIIDLIILDVKKCIAESKKTNINEDFV